MAQYAAPRRSAPLQQAQTRRPRHFPSAAAPLAWSGMPGGMRPELVVCFVVVVFDGGFLDGPVHAFDLPIGPWVIDFGEAVAFFWSRGEIGSRCAPLPFGDRPGVDAIALGQCSQALLTMLYRSTDRLSRRGAAWRTWPIVRPPMPARDRLRMRDGGHPTRFSCAPVLPSFKLWATRGRSAPVLGKPRWTGTKRCL